MKVALCAFAKLENLYLQEWIAYHLKLGFDKIYIYDNNSPKTERCEDGFEQDNRVVVFKHYMGKTDGGCKLQVEAYNEFYKRFGKDFDWVLFLDIDEFLTLTAHNDVHDYLEDVTRKNISATEITLFWKCYSDGGMLKYEPRPVRERFTEISENEEVNKYHKQFYKTKVKSLILRNIHYATPQTAIDNKGDWMPHLCNVTSEKPNHDLAYISHYATKTVEEYVCIKKKRRADGNSKKRLNMEHFFKFNKRTDEKANYFRELENEGDVEHVFGKVGNVNVLEEPKDGVSVCITAWNTQDYIEECLDSVAAQTWFKDHDNWEIVLGIDGCEKTLCKVKEIMYKYKNLRVLMMDSNKGTYVTSNTIMKESKYNWLIRFDSDDIMMPNMVENIMNKKENYDVVKYRCSTFTNDGIIDYNHYAEGSICINKKEFIKYGGYMPWRCSADSELRKRLKPVLKFLYINEPFYKLRRDNENSITVSKDTSMKSLERKINANYIDTISESKLFIEFVTNSFKEVCFDKIIVSFTTWKKRQASACKMLEHFKLQTLKPNKIICWLASDEYGECIIPKCLQKFVNENFIEVRWVKENTYCHKRYEVFKEHHNDYVFLIDDDIYYEPTYIEEMYNYAKKNKNCVINYMGNVIEYEKDRKILPLEKNDSLKNTLLSGLSCYPPNVFPMEYFDNSFAIKTISPKCDDSIMRVLLLKNNIKIYCIHNRSIKSFKSIPGTQNVGIWEENKIKVNEVSKKVRIFKNLISYFCLEDEAKKIWNDIVFENYGIKEKIIKKANSRNFKNFDLETPKTWCEKMQWLQLYDTKNDLKTFCADKIKVHEYSIQKLGKDICVPIIKVYNTPNDIVLYELPNKFILKCNHGYANNIIVKNKDNFNLDDAKEKLSKWLSEPFGVNTLEPHYVGIDRKCYAEALLEEPEKDDVVDYKFICFNGKPTYVQIISDRHNVNKRLNYYDMDFKFVDICRNDFPNNPNMLDEKPSQFELMKEYAKKLSEDFRFARIDFYEVDGTVYLGEITFTPASGFIKWTNENIDKKFGDMLIL